MKTDRFSEMGIASLLPGMQFMLDQMQEQINHLRQVLRAHQEEREEGLQQLGAQLNREALGIKRLGRPPGIKAKGGTGGASYWAKFTPEERTAEMRRRYKLSLKRRAKGLPPANPGVSRPRVNGKRPRIPNSKLKSYWASMTAAERSKEMLRRMALARKKNTRVNGAEANA